jgi:methanogenic corrinoid protein MtbC1
VDDDLAVPPSQNTNERPTPAAPTRETSEPAPSGARRRPKSESALADVIANDIVPRLLIQHRRKKGSRSGRITKSEAAGYALASLKVGADSLIALTTHFLDEGASVEAVLLELMVPAARHLGVLWERDEINFVDVTVGVQRMQCVLRVICGDERRSYSGDGPRVLLVPAPRETHTFGLLMLSELLHRQGWAVSGGLPLADEALMASVADQHFDLVGFSLSTDALLDQLADAIRIVRSSTCNPALKIAVGGRVFIDRPELANFVGADAAFVDATDFIAFADVIRSAFNARKPMARAAFDSGG